MPIKNLLVKLGKILRRKLTWISWINTIPAQIISWKIGRRIGHDYHIIKRNVPESGLEIYELIFETFDLLVARNFFFFFFFKFNFRMQTHFWDLAEILTVTPTWLWVAKWRGACLLFKYFWQLARGSLHRFCGRSWAHPKHFANGLFLLVSFEENLALLEGCR